MLTTSKLIEIWRGVPIHTHRISTAVNLTAVMGKLAGNNGQRVSIAIQNLSASPVSVQHSFNTDNELPLTIPPNGTYIETFESDSDQVTTEFFASSAGAGVTVNVIELILE